MPSDSLGFNVHPCGFIDHLCKLWDNLPWKQVSRPAYGKAVIKYMK